MSYDNKGSMTTTVVVSRDPDRSGNFVCDGTDTELQNAIDHLDALNLEATIMVKRGTYTLTNLSVDTPLKFKGEEGAVFNLNAKPCLTITVDATLVTFENIKFTSTLDGFGHVIMENPETRFVDCSFDLQLDTGAEDAVFRSEPVAKNKVLFRNCVAIQFGVTGADYFFFFKGGYHMALLLIDGFRVVEAIVDTGENQTVRLFTMDTDQYVDYFEVRNVIWEHVECIGAAFQYGRAYDVLVDNFVFLGGTWADSNSYMIPVVLNHGDVTINNMICFDRVHPHGSRGQNSITKVSNSYFEGDNTRGSSFDLPGVTGTYPRYAEFSNVTFRKKGALDLNSGIAKAVISNCTFLDSRIWIGDESTGDEMDVEITDCHWYYSGSGDYDYAIIINWDQGVKLPRLIISNCIAEYCEVFINMSGQPSEGEEVHIIVDHVMTYPDKGTLAPIFINNTGRTDDLQRVWIFDSYITTDSPPLADWNPIRDNDRFDNVVWWDIDDNAEVFSETAGKATIANAANNVVVTHNLVSTPDYDPANDLFGGILVTGTAADVTDLYVHTIGAAQFTIQKAAGVTGDDRGVFWKAWVTEFAG